MYAPPSRPLTFAGSSCACVVALGRERDAELVLALCVAPIKQDYLPQGLLAWFGESLVGKSPEMLVPCFYSVLSRVASYKGNVFSEHIFSFAVSR